MTSTRRHPFTVRKQSSGYTFNETWVVYKNGRRVSVHAHHSREGAQADADRFNVMEMTSNADVDSRPFEVRHAEARAAYVAETGRDAF